MIDCCCCAECKSKIAEQDDILCKPLRDRKCTNKCCLLLFIIFWLMFVAISVYAFIDGEPQRYLRGYDSYGNICGIKNVYKNGFPLSGKDLTNRRFVFFMNPNNLTHSPQICVEKCPTSDFEAPYEMIRFYRETNVSLCRYDINIEDYIKETETKSGIRALSEKGFGLCPKLPISATKSVLNRCVPTHLITTTKTVILNFYSFLNSNDLIRQIITDLMTAREEILIMIASALVISYILVFFIHFFASFVSYIIMWIFFLSVVAITSLLWYTYLAMIYEWKKLSFNLSALDRNLNEKSMLIICCVCTVVALILLFLVFKLKQQVKLIVALFYEAGSCIRAMPCLIFIPLRTICAIGIFTIYTFITALFLISCEHLRKKDILKDFSPELIEGQRKYLNDSAYYVLTRFYSSSWLPWLLTYVVFGLFWGIEFMIGCERAVVSGSVAAWYFTRDRTKLRAPLSTSFRIIFRKHLGTIAFGSLLLTLFKLPKFIVLYLNQKLRTDNENSWKKYLRTCLACLIYWVEKFLTFINHNAYIMMTIQGTGFCDSARNAFYIIISNAIKITAINSVGDFILFLGKCSVAAITAFIGLILLRNNDLINFYSAPIILSAIIGFWIANSVLTMYEMMIDSLFLCFCHDKKINDGTPGREYYAPLSLMSLLGKDDESGVGGWVSGTSVPLRDGKNSSKMDEGDTLENKA